MVRVKQVAKRPNRRPKRGAPITGMEEEEETPSKRRSTRKASTSAAPPSSDEADTSSDHEAIDADPRFKSTLYRELYYKTFTRRTICECRNVDFDALDLVHADFIRRWFKHQQWDKLLMEKHPIYPDLVRQFYTHFDHANKTAGVIFTWVKGKEIKLDEISLSRILKIPRGGVRAILPGKKWSKVKEFDAQKSLNAVLEEEDCGRTKKPEIYELPLPTRLLHLILFRSFNCRNGRLSSLTYQDMMVMYFLIAGIKMNMPRMMIDYMVTTQRSSKEGLFLPYGMWLTKVFQHFEVDLTDEVVTYAKQPFNDNTVTKALGYKYDTEAKKWVNVGVQRARKRKREPEVDEADIGDAEEDGEEHHQASNNAAMLESVVVQEMLRRMRPDIFTDDVMRDIRESAQSIIDARNNASVADEGEGEGTGEGEGEGHGEGEDTGEGDDDDDVAPTDNGDDSDSDSGMGNFGAT